MIEASRTAHGILRHELGAVVYGEDGPALDDPAETFHEASKLSPSFAGEPGPGQALLAESEAFQRLLARPGKRYGHRPRVRLPPPCALTAPLETALVARRSGCDESAPVTSASLSTILRAAYGTTGAVDGIVRRTVPSAGALYPLELYVLIRDVPDQAAGCFHYDPYDHALEELACGPVASLEDALADPELARAPAFVVVAAMFWRSRVKYGLRGYRFALLEAGHAMQNALLAAAALGIAALPIGGYFDRRLERLLALDGVDEAVVYCASLGGVTGADP